MHIDTQHRIDSARWAASPHCEPRPPWAAPELVVVHCVSLPEGQYGTGYPEQLFCGTLDVTADAAFADLAGLRVAPHLLIGRDGSVVQFVPFDQQAWHAGVSSWRGRERCNAFSIGIELEGRVVDDFTDTQHATLTDVLRALLEHYPGLSAENVVGHAEIAPGRKTDPGPGLMWASLLRNICPQTR